jgi:hypothetical protein
VPSTDEESKELALRGLTSHSHNSHKLCVLPLPYKISLLNCSIAERRLSFNTAFLYVILALFSDILLEHWGP